MIKLIEILTSVYVDKIEELISKIDWDKWGKEHIPTKISSQNIVNRIKNIHNYEGENATKYLKELKEQAKASIYVLTLLLEK
jgi:hypothetical protein